MNKGNYSLSVHAYNGLHDLLCKAPVKSTAERRNPNETNSHGDTMIPLSIPTKSTEGISHGLNTLPLFLPNYNQWLDSRPSAIRNSHDMQLQLDSTSSNPYVQRQLTVKWHYTKQMIEQHDSDVQDDDTPWEQLHPLEKQERIAIRDSRIRHQYCLYLTDSTRRYYYDLAKYFRMDTYHTQYNMTAYVSVCIEAIGIGWLTIPSEVKDYLETTTNGNKIRDGFQPNGLDHTPNGTIPPKAHTPINYDHFLPSQTKEILTPQPAEPKIIYTATDLEFYLKSNENGDYTDRIAEAKAYLITQQAKTTEITDEPTIEELEAASTRNRPAHDKTLQAFERLLKELGND